jgi:hypothetical protein
VTGSGNESMKLMRGLAGYLKRIYRKMPVRSPIGRIDCCTVGKSVRKRERHTAASVRFESCSYKGVQEL